MSPRRERYRELSIIVYVVMLALLLPLTIFLARQENTSRINASTTNSTTTPAFGGLGTCPGNIGCPSETPSGVVNGGQQNPKTVETSITEVNPSPSVTPCDASNASVASHGRSHHKHHSGAISDFMQFILQFFLELLNMLLQLLGGGSTPLPSPGLTPTPGPSDSLPNPCDPAVLPTDVPVTAVPSVAPSAGPSVPATPVTIVPVTEAPAITQPVITQAPPAVTQAPLECIASGGACDPSGARKCCSNACVPDINPQSPNNPGTCD